MSSALLYGENEIVQTAELKANTGTRAEPLPKTPEDEVQKLEEKKYQRMSANTHEGKQANSTESPSQANVEQHVARAGKQQNKARTAIIIFALGLIQISVFLAAMDINIVATALPTISAHFHSTAGYTWIGSTYNLAVAASTPVWGKISDIFGRKRVLLVANLVFFLGSLIAALAVSIGMLITARAIQGVGGGGLIILVNITISDLFSARDRGQYFGIIAMVWALASALGPTIGGVLTQKVTWRWCFYINLPLDGIAFIITAVFLDVDAPRARILDGLGAIDWLGSLAIVSGTIMLLLGLELGGVTFSWSSATVICLIIFGVVTIGLFLLFEWKRAPHPVMPLRLFRTRSNVAALLVCFIHGFVFIPTTYYLPFYYQAVRGVSPIMSGVYILAFALCLSVASAVTGIIIKKTGAYRPCMWLGFLVMTLGYGLYTGITATTSWTKIIIFQIVAGLGVGPNVQTPLIALQAAVDAGDVATATATFFFTRNLATAISVVIGGVIFQNGMHERAGTLVAELGPDLALQLSGGSTGASTQLVDSLSGRQQQVARVAIAESLATMWITYTSFSAVGLFISFFIAQKKLPGT